MVLWLLSATLTGNGGTLCDYVCLAHQCGNIYISPSLNWVKLCVDRERELFWTEWVNSSGMENKVKYIIPIQLSMFLWTMKQRFPQINALFSFNFKKMSECLSFQCDLSILFLMYFAIRFPSTRGWRKERRGHVLTVSARSFSNRQSKGRVVNTGQETQGRQTQASWESSVFARTFLTCRDLGGDG